MKKILIIISAICLILTLITLQKSFGLFETNISGDKNIEIANWNIYVNDYSLNNSNVFYVDNFTYKDRNGNQSSKLLPGGTGEFLITIDPKDTEVSIKYEFSVDTTELYEQIKINSITGQNGTLLTKTGDIYSGIIELDNLEVNVIKIVFEWEDDGNHDEEDSSYGLTENSIFNFPVEIKFTQYTG